ncbi:hypothetical protein O6H91_08G001900 [Diphasiastrum complanatum]|uniref:Uncharacterized protein n=2 Tax=Diphasiastrum complanatum TaxID=34168 RepID=A0ACC2CUB1_DIPCM|nr:hypothetical protein O6H91_08G001300 [Diphasiastrum complanatum]KAJ7545577.1 hypothetical protein O6H91_08G001900 [Diphasiastrum complanatum]
MSGATLAAGSRVATDSHTNGELKERVQETGTLGGMMGSLKVIQLQLVAFIVVFTASGLVPLIDIAFPLFATFYAFALNSMVFPSYKSSSRPEVFGGSRLFQVYVVLGSGIGLFLPLSYVLGGFSRGDRLAVRAASPHLFLLSCQILSENLISRLEVFSPPVRAILPIIYTGYRLITLKDWLHATVLKAKLPLDPHFKDVAWMWFGTGLAAANFVYYSINLCLFLIPMFLPRAFETYFRDRDAANPESAAQKSQMNHTGHKSE